MLILSSLLFCFSLRVLANTEIVNFRISEAQDLELSITNEWPKLNHTHNASEWNILPATLGTPLGRVCEDKPHRTSDSNGHACPHELWVVLDLTRDWNIHSSFTLRLSRPASYPADFSIQIYDPKSLSAHFGIQPQPRHARSSRQARHRYARIRAVNTGVLTPTPESQTKPAVPVPIPFILVLERLYFGVLPPSIIPVLAFIVFACLAAVWVVPKIVKHLEGIAMQAEKELDIGGKQE
ncbi:hypothetical protein LshimejAT787_1400620 [Lyophyllum shimeji]|uniref:Uncharacterized protein n=1 Tax=Lyophyllum shimeji TaxID=47721 RepID=A0A9P3PX05_LYOSH|nr:hypothetical protein LshimejAT787_1400620 [Lyophyllum shimeji]